MQASISEHVESASECLHRIESMIAKTDKSKTEPLASIVKEAIVHLKDASTAAFKQHIHYALSPDMFNPFSLHEIDRTYSRLALDEAGRTVIFKKHVVDPDPSVEPPSAEERMGNTIVVYSIMNGPQSESFVLHGELALKAYVEDEYDTRKCFQQPIIANNVVRHRLLSAIDPPPGKIDLDAVARLVVEALGNKPVKPHISTRSWYVFPKEYVLDVVCVHALVEARRRKLEIPGVGDRIDLEEEDTLARYLGMDTLDGKY